MVTLFESIDPPLRCVKISTRRANALIIQTRKGGERIRRPRKILRKTKQRISALRELSRSSRLSERQLNRIKKIRKRRQLARQCISAPLPDPFPEEDPTPNPPADPTPDPDREVEEVFTDSITQYGITWYFDKEYSYGQYENGDYWVKVGEDETVRVVEVDPTPQLALAPTSYKPVEYENRHVNGSMINPPTEKQAYDSRVAAYDDSLRVNFPVSIAAESSLVSSKSTLDFNCTAGSQGEGNYDLRGTCIPGRHHLQAAAVLTVVNEIPAERSFRPAFIGDEKKHFAVDDINLDLLPKIQPVEQAPEDLEYYLRGLQRPWISHISGANSRLLHPFENMLGYHSVVYSFYNDVALLTLIEMEQREELVLLYLQHAIDMQAMVLSGHGGSATSKHPLIFAGLLFEDPYFYQDINQRSQTPFRTDYMTYYGDGVTSPVVSDCLDEEGDPIPDCEVVPAGEFYHGYHVAWGQGGIHREYEHLNPEEWHKTEQCGVTGTRCDTYRHINSRNWSGPALSMRILGAMDLWNHEPFFDYVDRYVIDEENTPTEFRGVIWDSYR